MYSLILFEYAPRQNRFPKLPSVNPSDRMAYRPNRSNSRNRVSRVLAHRGREGSGLTSIGSKSFIALLLPDLFPVSPVLHHSYKKIGGRGARGLHPYGLDRDEGVSRPWSFQPLTSNFQSLGCAPIRPCVTSLFPCTWKQNCVHVKIRPCPNPLESASCKTLSHCAPMRPCVSSLFSTLSAKHSKKRPCLTPVDPNACRPRKKRPCLSPLESQSCKKKYFPIKESGALPNPFPLAMPRLNAK